MEYKLFLEDFDKRYLTKSGKETDDGDKISKVVFTLKGNEAAQVTGLVKQFEEINQLEKELKEKKSKIVCKSREICDTLSEAEDIVITRVLETGKAALTINAMTQRKNVKYDKAFAEMAETFTPEIIEKMNEIIESYTTITDVQSKVSGKMKESSFSDWAGKIIGFVQNLFQKIMSWAKSYDNKLDSFKAKYNLESGNEI